MLIDFACSEKSFQEVTEKLLEIFSQRWEWIYAESITEKGKAVWKTINRRSWRYAKERGLPLQLTDEKLLEVWKSPKEVVGVGFGKTTKYLMLDIDAGSPYHPSKGKELDEIKGELEELGLAGSVAVQSSNSGGIHVYYPLRKAVGSYALARTVTEHLTAAGYEVANGKLEIFPNKKALGKKDDPSTWTQYQRHRLPLQQGSVVLDQEYEPDTSMVEVFLQQWEWCEGKQDQEGLEAALGARKQFFIKKKDGGVSKGLQPIKEEYEALLKEGFVSAHRTNDILIQLGRQTRILEGLGGVALRDKLIDVVTELPNYEEYCEHKHEIERRCQEIARWAERSHRPAGSKAKESEPLPPAGKNNEEKKQDAIERIQGALAEIETLKEIFISKTSFLKAIAKKAKSSISTLVKYWEKLLEPIFSKYHSEKSAMEKAEKIDDEIVCNSAPSKSFSDFGAENPEQKIVCNPLPSKDSSDFSENPYTKDVGRSPRPLAETKRETEKREIENYVEQSKRLEDSRNQNKQKSVELVISKLRRLKEKISAAYDNKSAATAKNEISGAYQLERRKIPRWLAEFGLHRKCWYLYGAEVPRNGLATWWVLANKPPKGTPAEKLELVEVDVPVPT